MPCYRLPGARPGFICGFHPVYRFDGWIFEVHRYHGPWPLRKDGEPRVYAPPAFWEAWDQFVRLPEKAKEALRVKE